MRLPHSAISFQQLLPLKSARVRYERLSSFEMSSLWMTAVSSVVSTRICAAGQSDLGGRSRADKGLYVGGRFMERTRDAHENEQCRIYNCGNGLKPGS